MMEMDFLIHAHTLSTGKAAMKNNALHSQKPLLGTLGNNI